MRLGAVIVLAMLAALVWAPSPVVAATNILHSPAATPTVGTVITSFRLHVEYRGVFPATSVEAQLAALSVPMTLVAGSPRDGAWEASVALPPGTWPVTFAGAAERGADPTLAGPVITVGAAPTVPRAPATAPATAPGDPAAPDRQSDDVEGVREPPAPGAVTPAPAPRGTATPDAEQRDSQDATVAPSSRPATDSPAAAPSSPTAGLGGVHGDGDQEHGAMAGDTGSAGDVGDASPEASSARATTGPGTSALAQPESAARPFEPEDGGEPRAAAHEVIADTARLMAAWAAGLLVVSAVMLGLIGRRRRHGATEAEAMAAAASAETILERRAMRRARRPMPDDPIIASLGLDEESRRRAARGPSMPDEDGG